MTETSTYEPVIGLEVHAQLLTSSKMFCGCSAAYSGAAPNTHTCVICAGLPGSLPGINAKALQCGLMTGVALNCEIAEESKFDRKNYSYPDLPKGYQISQYDQPIASHGWIDFQAHDRILRWGIIRVHLEEDTGKTFHVSRDGQELSLVDYNRSGVPLMEIVTTPESRSPADARDFFMALRQILMYLGVNDGNLQEGSLRVDANISLRTPGGELGTKVEIKNLNSFRALERALEYEVKRQSDLLASGQRVEQETRGWSEHEEVTTGQRSKEYAHDYRYFPEPDLPPLLISRETVEALRDALPELPLARTARLEAQYGVTPHHAHVLTQERALVQYFETAARGAPEVPGRVLANWITGDLLHILNEKGLGINESPVSPEGVAELVGLVHSGEINGAAGKKVLDEMFSTAETPSAIVERLDLQQIPDEGVGAMVEAVLERNPRLVETYRNGKMNVIEALVGKVMAESKGKANPARVREALTERLTKG